MGTQIVHLVHGGPGLHQRFHRRRVAPQRSDVQRGLSDRISITDSSTGLENVLDRDDVISLSSTEQRVLLPLEDLRGTDADTASKSKKRPPTSITLGDDSYQGSEGTVTLQNAEIHASS